jgi:hypothetical protein
MAVTVAKSRVVLLSLITAENVIPQLLHEIERYGESFSTVEGWAMLKRYENDTCVHRFR